MPRLSRVERERRAAVRGLWEAAAMGGVPSDTDLAALGYPEPVRARILTLAADVAAHRAAGDHQGARIAAADAAELTLQLVGPDWSPPSGEPNLDGLDPGQLAHFLTTGALPGGPTDPDDPMGIVASIRR
jgi:hypothetical protein